MFVDDKNRIAGLSGEQEPVFLTWTFLSDVDEFGCVVHDPALPFEVSD